MPPGFSGTWPTPAPAELFESGPLQGLTAADQPFVLATIHRAENTDDPACLEAILTALGQAPSPVLLPPHPLTRARIA